MNDDNAYRLDLLTTFNKTIRYTLSCGEPHGKPYVFLFDLSDERVRKVAERVFDDNRADHASARRAITPTEVKRKLDQGLTPVISISFDRQVADLLLATEFGIRSPWQPNPIWKHTFPCVVLAKGSAQAFSVGRFPFADNGDVNNGGNIDPTLGTGSFSNHLN